MTDKRKKLAALASAAALIAATSSCSQKQPDGLIYGCDEYSVYADSVVQGRFTAVAVSPLEIKTNYESPELSGASSKVEFRFSLNSRDNEFPLGSCHTALIGDTASDNRIYTFGSLSADEPADSEGATLPNDTRWTVRVDMRPILRSFKQLGYYATATGDTIFSDDFKGIWVAGSVDPLSWDFENLYGKDDRKLTDRGDSIYEVTLTVNPKVDRPANPTGWKIDAPDERYPRFEAQQKLLSALYNMGIADIASNIRPDDTFRAGKEWDGVWTRDVAYSIYLSLAYLDPQRSINSLRAKVKNGHIIQDTGTGGAWPVSSDRVVWGLAAWEIYLVTGDTDWLNEAFSVVVNTLQADLDVCYDPHFKLMHGEQSYLDWREQTYPRWMQPKDIYESMCLGTNVVFARVCEIAGLMHTELERIGYEMENPGDARIIATADTLKQSINNRLWLPSAGYYSEYLYGGVYPIQSQATDNLGQALSVILGIATPDMAKSIVTKTPVVAFGTSSVYPQQPDIKPYHNDAVWPFVQTYWNLAAAKTGNMKALTAGLAAVYRAAAMFATNKELFVASNGDYRGTAINSDSQLWSCAGNVAMVYRVFAGMNFEADGIHFTPVVPATIPGEKKITGFKYRDASIDITINGTGSKISRFAIDGKESKEAVLPADIKGNHAVEITLEASKEEEDSSFNLTSQKWMPATPVMTWGTPTAAVIDNYSADNTYSVYINGVLDEDLKADKYTLGNTDRYTVADFVATDKNHIAGFTPRPHEYIPAGSMIMVQAEEFGKPGTKYITDPAKASRFVELTRQPLEFSVIVPQSGDYFIDVRYANGAGPINTENKCAIRTLAVDGVPAGPIVMPQRGIGEWLSTGYSNMLTVALKAGSNRMSIAYLPHNENMNGEFNTALIDYIRIIKK